MKKYDFEKDIKDMYDVLKVHPKITIPDWNIHVEIDKGIVSYYDIYLNYKYTFPMRSWDAKDKISKDYRISFNFPTGHTTWGKQGTTYIEVDSFDTLRQLWCSEFTVGKFDIDKMYQTIDETLKRIDIVAYAELHYHLKCYKCGLSGIKSHFHFDPKMYLLDTKDVYCTNSKRCSRRVRKNKRK